MKERSKSSYQTYIYDFLKFDILVRCPNCSKRAIVKTDGFQFREMDEDNVRVVCTSCGFAKRLEEQPSSWLVGSRNKKDTGRHYVIGGPIDPIFFLPVWLRTEVEGNLLWAYNYEHLEFLQTHIGSTLRERNGQDKVNKSLGSRLPRWMTSKKNRALVLKKIEMLYDMG